MHEPEFSGIDPLRVPEARRRLAAIRAYLAMPNPTAADTKRLADGIGLSRTQFGRLARVWQDHRDARLLVIGARGPTTRDYGVDRHAVAIAREVIRAAGAGAALAGVAPEVERQCAEDGVAPPARATLHNWIRTAAARAPAAADGPARIVVGRLWFHLPVDGMPVDAMPTLLAAVLLPERGIVAHVVSTDPGDPPSVAGLVDAVADRRALGARRRPLLLDADDRRVAAGALERAGLGATRAYRRSVQRELSKALGGRLGPLAAIIQRGMARPATKRVITRQDAALPPEGARDAIERAVAAHNASSFAALASFDLCVAAGD